MSILKAFPPSYKLAWVGLRTEVKDPVKQVFELLNKWRPVIEGHLLYLRELKAEVEQLRDAGYLTESAADLLYAALAHTHTKSDVTDLETITTTPTADAVPKADGSGDIDAGWLPDLSGTYATASHTHIKSGITDLETITATPTASAVPKADGSGDIDAGWIPDLSGTYVPKTLFDGNTLLKADSDDTPLALTVVEDRLVGRKTGGTIDALTASEVKTLLGLGDMADQDSTAVNIDGGDIDDVRLGFTTRIRETATDKFGLGKAAIGRQGALAAAETAHALSASYNAAELEGALDNLGSAINAVQDLLNATGGFGFHAA